MFLSHIRENLPKMRYVGAVDTLCGQNLPTQWVDFHGISEVSDFSLSLRVSSYTHRTLFFFVKLEISTLRLDCVLSLQISMCNSNQNDRVP